jgi:hypothetical protein
MPEALVMIDWWGIWANSLWVAGLATGLAAFSMAYYKAQSEPVPLRRAIQDVGFQFPFCIGMVLFGLGLLFSGQSLGERIIGGLAAVGFVTQAARLWQHRRADRSES